MANGAVVPAASVGSRLVSLGSTTLDLENVRHVPSLDASLISMGKLVRDGWRFFQQDYDGHHFIIFESSDRSQVLTAQLTDEDMYVLRSFVVSQPVYTVRDGQVHLVAEAPFLVQNQSHVKPPAREDTLLNWHRR